MLQFMNKYVLVKCKKTELFYFEYQTAIGIFVCFPETVADCTSVADCTNPIIGLNNFVKLNSNT